MIGLKGDGAGMKIRPATPEEKAEAAELEARLGAVQEKVLAEQKAENEKRNKELFGDQAPFPVPDMPYDD